MYTLLIGAVIGAIGFLLWTLNGGDLERECGSMIFFSFLGCTLGIIIAFIPAFLIGDSIKGEWITVSKLELRQLKLNSKIEGRFFLFSGKVGEEDYYYFYSKQPDTGFLSLERVPRNTSYIIEDGKNYVEIQQSLPRKDERIKLKFGFLCGKKISRCIFHIPENSIQNYFEVGLEN